MQKLWRMESMDEPEKHYSVEILFKLIQCKYIIGQRIIYYGQRFNIRSPFVLFLTLILFFCSFFIFLMRLSEKSFFFLLIFPFILCPPPIPIPRQTTFSNIFVRRFCRRVLRSDCARHFQIFRATVALIYFFFSRLFASSNVNICVHLSWKLLLTPLYDWNFARTWTNMQNLLGYASSAFAFSPLFVSLVVNALFANEATFCFLCKSETFVILLEL